MVRFKNRYITVEITPLDNQEKPLVLKTTALHNAVQEKVLKLYGDFGQAAIKSGFNAKYCNTHTRIALIKVRHGPHKFVLDAVPSINDVGGRFVKKHQQRKLEEMWSELRSDLDRENMQKALMTLEPSMKDFA